MAFLQFGEFILIHEPYKIDQNVDNADIRIFIQTGGFPKRQSVEISFRFRNLAGVLILGENLASNLKQFITQEF